MTIASEAPERTRRKGPHGARLSRVETAIALDLYGRNGTPASKIAIAEGAGCNAHSVHPVLRLWASQGLVDKVDVARGPRSRIRFAATPGGKVWMAKQVIARQPDAPKPASVEALQGLRVLCAAEDWLSAQDIAAQAHLSVDTVCRLLDRGAELRYVWSDEKITGSPAPTRVWRLTSAGRRWASLQLVYARWRADARPSPTGPFSVSQLAHLLSA